MFKITGTVKVIFPTAQVTEKFAKREFVLTESSSSTPNKQTKFDKENHQSHISLMFPSAQQESLPLPPIWVRYIFCRL